MQELSRPPQVRNPGGPSGFDDIVGDGGPGTVTVHSGVHAEPLPVGNMSVGEIRRRFADRMEIDPNSTAQIDGRDVDPHTIVRPGQMLSFVRSSGEKG